MTVPVPADYQELTGSEWNSFIFRQSWKAWTFWKGKKTVRGFKGFLYLLCRLSKPKGLKLIPTRAGKMLFDFRDDVMAPEIFSTGVHEPLETSLWLEGVQPGQTVIDVGANVGYYTLLASKRAGETGAVYSFEPGPENFRLLMENIRLNGCRNVQPVQKALSSQAGRARLAVSHVNYGAHRLVSPTAASNDLLSHEVETVTLDEFAEQKNLRVDWIKMDIEGAEALVFEGGRRVIQRDRPHFLLEFWPRGLTEMGSDPKGLLKLIQHLGYQIRPLYDKPEKIMEDLSDVLRLAESHTYVNLLLTRRVRDLTD